MFSKPAHLVYKYKLQRGTPFRFAMLLNVFTFKFFDNLSAHLHYISYFSNRILGIWYIHTFELKQQQQHQQQ